MIQTDEEEGEDDLEEGVLAFESFQVDREEKYRFVSTFSLSSFYFDRKDTDTSHIDVV